MRSFKKVVIFIYFCFFLSNKVEKKAERGLIFLFSFIGVIFLFFLDVIFIGHQRSFTNPFLDFIIIFTLPLILSYIFVNNFFKSNHLSIKRFVSYKKYLLMKNDQIATYKIIGWLILISPLIGLTFLYLLFV